MHFEAGTEDAPVVERARVQGFFAGLYAETRRPTYGDAQRDFIRNLLLRAQEAGLYEPTKETP